MNTQTMTLAPATPLEDLREEVMDEAPDPHPQTITVVEHPIEEEQKPWQTVTSRDVRKAISGTRLETLVGVLESVTKPRLPLEITLPKALALAGAALSQPHSWDYESQKTDDGIQKVGADLLRLKIRTANGQACNVWSLIVGESGSGKDIGQLPRTLANLQGWLIASSGSAEGLKDAYVKKGSGLLNISEFERYLNPRRWEYGCRDFLTAAFNTGWFKESLSQAGKTKAPRETPFCYPSVLANIQPEVFLSQVDALGMATGFFQRFLISYVKHPTAWRPSTVETDDVTAYSALEEYENLSGDVVVPEDYLQFLMDEFLHNEASIPSHFSRLVNEYGPRFSVMLADDPLHLKDDHWEKAAIMVRWFYSMAENLLGQCGDPRSRERETRLAKYKNWIKEYSPVTATQFAQRFSRNTRKEDRRSDLEELDDRGDIRITKDGNRTVLIAA